MLGSAQVVSPKPTLLPPATPPTGASPGPHGGPSFMQIMNEQPAMVTPPKTGPVPEAPEAHGSADAAPPAPAPSANANAATRRKESTATPPKASGTPPPASQPGAQASEDAAAADASAQEATGTSDSPDDAGDAPGRTSSLTEFTQLIGLAVPTPVAPTDAALASAQALAADGTAAAVDSQAGTTSGRPGAVARPARGLPGSDDPATGSGTRPTDPPDPQAVTVDRRLPDTAVRGADAARARATEAVLDKAALATRSNAPETLTPTSARAADTPALRSPGATDGAPSAFAAVLAQSMPNGIAAPDAAPAPATGQVHAALHSPGFAPELAAKVSLLAADGVQQAELQLNPADMGPVAVQIIVDGAQAQVSFHAVQAETRQALERSLPDLAAALQGQGLTLSGGGVFQQARRDAQASDGDARGSQEGSRRASGSAGDRIGSSPGTSQVTIRRAAGLLDTFA